MGQNGDELEAWGQLRTTTLSMGPRPLPTTAQRAEAGGGAPDSNNPISAAPTAWEKPAADWTSARLHADASVTRAGSMHGACGGCAPS